MESKIRMAGSQPPEDKGRKQKCDKACEWEELDVSGETLKVQSQAELGS